MFSFSPPLHLQQLVLHQLVLLQLPLFLPTTSQAAVPQHRHHSFLYQNVVGEQEARGGKSMILPSTAKGKNFQSRGKIVNESIQQEHEAQMADLKKRYNDKDFALMTKNLNRFCFPNLINCMPLIFGALQVGGGLIAFSTPRDWYHAPPLIKRSKYENLRASFI